MWSILFYLNIDCKVHKKQWGDHTHTQKKNSEQSGMANKPIMKQNIMETRKC